MSYCVLRYAYTSFCGKVRINHEDNFWCLGANLPIENAGMDEVLSGMTTTEERARFAVFDGMGGEAYGEVAAWIGSECMSQEANKEIPVSDLICRMNEEVCEYIKNNKIRTMGSTVAVLECIDDKVVCANLGDSKIYHFRDDKLTQISEDHVDSCIFWKKPPLTQCLGIPKDEFQVLPSVTSMEAKCGDRYLLVTDGVTDLIPDFEIENILKKDISLSEMVEQLENMVMENGAKDNTTIVLVEVSGIKIKGVAI